jgi:2-oxoglutarate dehydrogenase E2 component (dihydrolipoamide succinyltransferase)
MSDAPWVRIEAPRVNANEDKVALAKWLVADGEAVSPGQAVCEVQSSKAVVEVESPAEGFMHRAVAEGVETVVGAMLGAVSKGSARPADLDARPAATPADAGGPVLSDKACRRAAELGVPLDAFAGMSRVREADVDRIARERGVAPATPSLVPLSAAQRAVAAAVAESWRAIPASTVEMRLDASAVLDKARDLSRRHRLMVSPLVLALAGLARSLKEFPAFNASLEGVALRVADSVNVNVLMEVEGGLLNPVMRQAEAKTVEALARELGDLQKRAALHRLAAEDFQGGTITMTSLFGTGVVRLSPIIYPGQTAILGLADVDAASSPPTINMAVTFDHRVANALAAARLLKALTERILAL